jgi:hypothetical protein
VPTHLKITVDSIWETLEKYIAAHSPNIILNQHASVRQAMILSTTVHHFDTVKRIPK